MLNLRRHQLTDDEFVERVRRQAQTTRKAGIVFSVLFSICLIVFFFVIPSAFHIVSDLGKDPHAVQRGFGYGLIAGAVMGYLLFVIVWQLIHSLMMAFGYHFSRIHKLLLKYHDLASSLNIPPPPESPASK